MYHAITSVVNFATGNRVTSLAPENSLVGISVTDFVKFVHPNVPFVPTPNYPTLTEKQGKHWIVKLAVAS
jgi:hypothetical protein